MSIERSFSARCSPIQGGFINGYEVFPSCSRCAYFGSFSGGRGGRVRSFLRVTVPYIAMLAFLGGVAYRVLNWGRSPVPFRIPTTAGQQKSLPWIKHAKFDNPVTKGQVVGRMLLEVLLFRSLFRNTKFEMHKGPKIFYQWEKWLWLAGLAFHYAFFVILIRHLRFFTATVPFFVQGIERLDGFFQVGLPGIYITDAVFIIAVTYILIRRLVIPQVRYISLPQDYFPLLLLFAIGTTGILTRYFIRVDLIKVKQLAMGLISFHPVVPEGIGVIFFIHFFLVSTLGCLLSLQQADARGRRFTQPDAKSAQRQPHRSPHKSMELPSEGPHIRAI